MLTCECKSGTAECMVVFDWKKKKGMCVCSAYLFSIHSGIDDVKIRFTYLIACSLCFSSKESFLYLSCHSQPVRLGIQLNCKLSFSCVARESSWFQKLNIRVTGWVPDLRSRTTDKSPSPRERIEHTTSLRGVSVLGEGSIASWAESPTD